MFAKWLEEYQKLFQQTRFISQLGTFLVALFAFLSCWKLSVALSKVPNFLSENWNEVLLAISFHLLTAVVFSGRFISLFFKSKRSFWFGQVLWLVCLLTVLGYYMATNFAIYGNFFQSSSKISFGLSGDLPYDFWLYADGSFAFFTLIYLIFSPVRQLITAIVAFIKSK